MTTDTDHEYITRTDLDLSLARLENKLGEKIEASSWRLVALILPIYALVIGTIVAVVLFSLNILSRLPQT